MNDEVTFLGMNKNSSIVEFNQLYGLDSELISSSNYIQNKNLIVSLMEDKPFYLEFIFDVNNGLWNTVTIDVVLDYYLEDELFALLKKLNIDPFFLNFLGKDRKVIMEDLKLPKGDPHDHFYYEFPDGIRFKFECFDMFNYRCTSITMDRNI